MASSPRHGDTMHDLLGVLERASQQPAKQRATKITSLVDDVCTRAYNDGLLIEELSRLIDITTLPNHLDQSSIGNLIRNLYPVSKVPNSIVVEVVGSLGHGRLKPSYSTQALLLKWLVMVYEVLENPRILSQLYSVLFNLLDTSVIRPQVCHVLALITRRKHVRLFRIQNLMELIRQAGNQPPLIGLMRVFKDYYPDVIVDDATAGRASVFVHPNPEWRTRLGDIQDVHFQKTQDGVPVGQRTFRVSLKGANGIIRKSNSVVPSVHTSHAQESSITLEEIEDVHEFVQKLEKIELPNQLVAVIDDPLLQKFLHMRSSDVDSSRIDSWLLAFFEDQMQHSNGGEGNILRMLRSILGYTRYTKRLPPACLMYLQSTIHTWDGTTGAVIILSLLTYLPADDFQGLYNTTLEPLENAILSSDRPIAESQTTLLTFYTNLLSQWTTTLLSTSSVTHDSISAVASLIRHTSPLCLTLLQNPTITTHTTILTFYTRTTYLHTHPSLGGLLPILLPPDTLIYTLHFTDSLCTLSHLCELLATYKKAFEHAMTPEIAARQPYDATYVANFNGFLMDICNCLWRSRAFNTADTNARGCLLRPDITQSLSKYVTDLDNRLSLTTLFMISYSPLLCRLAIEYVRELEDGSMEEIERRHAGPVTQASLKALERNGELKLGWMEYRLGFLRWLDGKGVVGISELMYNTMKQLLPNREARLSVMG